MESVVARARRRARSPPARACSSPFSTSHVTSHESTATRVAIDRRSRWEKGRRGNTQRGGLVDGSRPVEVGGPFPALRGDGMEWAIARAG